MLKAVENKPLKVQQEHAALLGNFGSKTHIEQLKLEGKPIKVINYNQFPTLSFTSLTFIIYIFCTFISTSPL